MTMSSARADVPSGSFERSTSRLTWPWKLGAVCTFFPVTGILHHRIFVKPHCLTGLMSNRQVFMEWITTDASPWLGLLVATAAYITVLRRPRLRFWVAAFPLAFIPLCVWLWDIPGAQGVICPMFHDKKIFLRSWHLYLFGVAAYVPIVRLLQRRAHAPS